MTASRSYDAVSNSRRQGAERTRLHRRPSIGILVRGLVQPEPSLAFGVLAWAREFVLALGRHPLLAGPRSDG